MNLNDEEELVEAAIFNQLLLEPGPEEGHTWNTTIYGFDWAAAWAEANEPIEPWHWPWKTPLRELTEQLIGRPDVTSWTQESASKLAAILNEPAERQLSILGLRESPTQQLPTVDREEEMADTSDPVSAEEHDE